MMVPCLIGLWLGALFGALAVCLCVAAAQREQQYGRWR